MHTTLAKRATVTGRTCERAQLRCKKGTSVCLSVALFWRKTRIENLIEVRCRHLRCNSRSPSLELNLPKLGKGAGQEGYVKKTFMPRPANALD